MQLVEDAGLLPSVQSSPAGLSRAEPQLQGQELPGYVVVEDVQDALQTQPVRHRPRPRRLLGPGRQQRFDQRPQVVVHDPRPSAHNIPNGRIVISVTPDQGTSTRSCYELKGFIGGDRHGILFPTLRQNLEQQLRPTTVKLHIAELVDTQKIDAAVAGDGLGQQLLVGGLHELVDELGGQACRMLRLPTIRTQYPELAEAALRDQMTYRGMPGSVPATTWARPPEQRWEAS